MQVNHILLFWKEIDQIQKRHILFFPIEQKDQISIKRVKPKPILVFHSGYDLPSVITLEIEFIFKLIFETNPVRQ